MIRIEVLFGVPWRVLLWLLAFRVCVLESLGSGFIGSFRENWPLWTPLPQGSGFRDALGLLAAERGPHQSSRKLYESLFLSLNPKPPNLPQS